MFEVYVKETFSAAHFLPDYDGVCANLHGHTWTVELTVRSEALNGGMVIDFVDIKAAIRETLPDHTLLNDILTNPTAENLARYFYNDLKKKIPGLTKVVVWESPTAGASYFEG